MSSINFWQLAGFLLVSALGSFLHFLFPLTNSKVLALFSSVNESVWEHMKILFFPMLFFALIEYIFIGRQIDNFWCTKLRGTLFALILIPVLFYTASGIFGRLPDLVNIALFFISAAVGFVFETRHFGERTSLCFERPAILILCALALIFMVFTFAPPHIPLFLSTTDNSYGI